MATLPVVLATGGYDHVIRIWDVAQGTTLRTFRVPDSQINALAISPDRRYVAAATHGSVKIFDLLGRGDTALVSLDGHAGNVTHVGFDHGGSWMFSSGDDGTTRVWDPRAGSGAAACQRVFSAFGSGKPASSNGTSGPPPSSGAAKALFAVNSVVLHPSQVELVTGDQGGYVRIYDLASSSSGTVSAPSVSVTPEPDVAVRSIATAADGTRVVAATDSGRVHQYIPASPGTLLPATPETAGSVMALERSFQAHDTYVLCSVISPDGKLLATSSADNTIKIWRTADMKLLRVLSKHSRWVWSLAFSIDSSFLISASSDHSVRLWDLGNGNQVKVFSGHVKSVTSVALNDSGGAS